MTAPRARSLFVCVLAASLLAIGCSDVTTTFEQAGAPWTVDESADEESEPEDIRKPTVGPVDVQSPEKRLPTNPPRHDYEVHEWGTFTSVQSSDGTYLDGLHHEEESLPAFVHQFDYAGVGGQSLESHPRTKGLKLAAIPEPVNQKLETPVIYFHTDQTRDIDVRVDFPDGYISEWYPRATERSPQLEFPCLDTGDRCYSDARRKEYGIDRLADGFMTWEVDVTNEPREVIPVSPDDIWAPSREVPRAAWVSTEHENEKFIFYRGIGRFKPEIRVTSEAVEDSRNRFSIANSSDNAVPALFYLNVGADGGTLRSIGSLGAESETTFETAVKVESSSKKTFVEEAQFAVGEALVETGLTGTEARAMVDTWEESYFRREGHRILYIVPRSWTDELLPIKVEPRPDRLVRTLVGRIDLLTPRKEAAMVERVKQAHRNSTPLTELSKEIGRFAEPRFRQVCPRLEGPVADWCDAQVKTLQSNVMFEHRDP